MHKDDRAVTGGCEAHSIDKSMMFSTTLMEELGITFQLSGTFLFLETTAGPSSRDRNKNINYVNNGKSGRLFAFIKKAELTFHMLMF